VDNRHNHPRDMDNRYTHPRDMDNMNNHAYLQKQR
jgi:hypothetical protein